MVEVDVTVVVTGIYSTLSKSILTSKYYYKDDDILNTIDFALTQLNELLSIASIELIARILNTWPGGEAIEELFRLLEDILPPWYNLHPSYFHSHHHHRQQQSQIPIPQIEQRIEGTPHTTNISLTTGTSSSTSPVHASIPSVTGIRVATNALRSLMYFFRVSVTTYHIQKLFDYINPNSKHQARPYMQLAIMDIIEYSAITRCDNKILYPSFWTLPGRLSEENDKLSSSSHSSSSSSTSPSSATLHSTGQSGTTNPLLRSGYLSLALPSNSPWPFTREYGIFTILRFRSLERGIGDRKSSILRVVGTNGARLHIWLQEKHNSNNSIHVDVYDPPDKPVTAPPIFTGGSLIGAAAKGVFAAASAGSKALLTTVNNIQQQIQTSPLLQAPVGSVGQPGFSSAIVDCHALVPNNWFSVHVYHRFTRGILGGGTSELQIYVNNTLISVSSDVAYPRSLASNPLSFVRFGEALEGEIGALYLFGESMNGTPLSSAAQTDLTKSHTGEDATFTTVPRAISAPSITDTSIGNNANTMNNENSNAPLSSSSPISENNIITIPEIWASFHPSSVIRSYSRGKEPVTENGDTLSFVCPDVLGHSGTVLLGINGVNPFCCLSIRDAFGSIGGIKALLPLFDTASAFQRRGYHGNIGGNKKINDASIPYLLLNDGLPLPSGSVRPIDTSKFNGASGTVTTGRRSISAQVIDIIAAFLYHHRTNQQVALASTFPQLLRLQLSWAFLPPRWLLPVSSLSSSSAVTVIPLCRNDRRLIPAIIKLYQSCTETSELQLELLRTLIVWLPLYASADPDVQFALLSTLKNFVWQRPSLLRNQIGMTNLMDAISIWYARLCGTSSILSDDLVLGRPPRMSRKRGRKPTVTGTGTSSTSSTGTIRSSSVDSSQKRENITSTVRLPDHIIHQLLREAMMIIACTLNAASLLSASAAGNSSVTASRSTGSTVPLTPGGKLSTNDDNGPRSPKANPSVNTNSAPVLNSGTLPPALLGNANTATQSTASSETIIPVTKDDIRPFIILLSGGTLNMNDDSVSENNVSSSTSSTTNNTITALKKKLGDFYGLRTVDAEYYRAHILSLITGMVDHDCTRLSNSREIAASATATVKTQGNNLALPPGRLASDVGPDMITDALNSNGYFNILQALDSVCGENYPNYLLLGILPTIQTDTLFAAALRGIFHAQRAAAARAQRLDDRVRDFAGQVGRKLLRAAGDAERIRSTLANAVTTVVSNVKGSSGENESNGMNVHDGTGSNSSSSFDIDGGIGVDGTFLNSTPLSYFGSLWARAFDRTKGFDIVFHAIKNYLHKPTDRIGKDNGKNRNESRKLPPAVYGALLEALFLPDPVSLLMGVTAGVDTSLSGTNSGTNNGIVGGGNGALATMLEFLGDTSFAPEARSMGLTVAAEHALARYTGYVPWIVPVIPAHHATDDEKNNSSTRTTSSTYTSSNGLEGFMGLPERSALSSPAVAGLLFRLLPIMPSDLALRAVLDIHQTCVASDASTRALLNNVVAWDVLLVRFLLRAVPRAYPSRLELQTVDKILTNLNNANVLPVTKDGSSNSSSLIAKENHSLALGHSSAASDALFAACERLLTMLLRSSMDNKGGWFPYRRLFALTPLLRVPGTRPSLIWSLPFSICSAQARHSRRLLIGLVLYGLGEYNFANNRIITKVHIDNLIHLTALVEREVSLCGGPGSPPTPHANLGTRGDLSIVETTSLDAFAHGQAPHPVRLTSSDATDSAASSAPSANVSKSVVPALEERLDFILATSVLSLWDRLLTPSPDREQRTLSMRATSYPGSGNLRDILMSLSLWIIAVCPPDHPEILKTFMRLQRIAKQLLSETNAGRLRSLMDDGAPLSEPVSGTLGETVPSSDKIDDGGTKPRNDNNGSSSGSENKDSASSNRSITVDTDWEEVTYRGPGRLSIPPLAWVAFLLHSINSYLREVRNRLELSITSSNSALKDNDNGEETPTLESVIQEQLVVPQRNDPSSTDLSALSAGADLATLTLTHIFTDCPQGSRMAHVQLSRLQSFLEGYQLHLAALSARQRRNTSSPPPLGGDNLSSGLPSSRSGGYSDSSVTNTESIKMVQHEWLWLLGDILIDDNGYVIQRDAALTVDAVTNSSAWVPSPGWTGEVPTALDILANAATYAYTQIDNHGRDIWRAILTSMRADAGILTPWVNQNERIFNDVTVTFVNATKKRLTGSSAGGKLSGLRNLIGRARSSSLSNTPMLAEDGGIEADFSNLTGDGETNDNNNSSNGNVVTNAVGAVVGFATTTARTNVVSAVNVAKEKFDLFKTGLKKGIAALAAAADADEEAENHRAALEGRESRPGIAGGTVLVELFEDTNHPGEKMIGFGDGSSTNPYELFAVEANAALAQNISPPPPLVLDDVPFSPRWWQGEWLQTSDRVSRLIGTLLVQQKERLQSDRMKREDIYHSVKLIYRSLLLSLAQEGGAWELPDHNHKTNGLLGGSIVHRERIARTEDAQRRRLRMEPNVNPVDYGPAAYKSGHGSITTNTNTSGTNRTASGFSVTVTTTGIPATTESTETNARNTHPIHVSIPDSSAPSGTTEDTEVLLQRVLSGLVKKDPSLLTDNSSAQESNTQRKTDANNENRIRDERSDSLDNNDTLVPTSKQGDDSMEENDDTIDLTNGSIELSGGLLLAGINDENDDDDHDEDGNSVTSKSRSNSIVTANDLFSTEKKDNNNDKLPGPDYPSISVEVASPTEGIMSPPPLTQPLSVETTPNNPSSLHRHPSNTDPLSPTHSSLSGFALSPGETILFNELCKLITADGNQDGILRVSTRFLYFLPLPSKTKSETKPTDSNDFRRHYVRTSEIRTSTGNDPIEEDEDDEDTEDLYDQVEKDKQTTTTVTSTSVSSNSFVPVSPPTKVIRTPPVPVPRRWSLTFLTRMLPRRYLLIQSAAEFFFLDGESVFVAVGKKKVADLLQKVWDTRPPRLLYNLSVRVPDVRAIQKYVERSKLAERWARRELTNFEYLMELNTLAGRSYNDLTQYFIMPWIIADYTSPFLNLDDPKSYRDLSKPVGALNPDRLETFRQRMIGMGGASMTTTNSKNGKNSRDGGDPNSIPPFLYGSHYSSAGITLFYLIRMEPFTSLAVELQGGRFDCPDRLFFSVPECWHGVTHSMSDVKELIPEWYTTPEMFMNAQDLPLGYLQDGNSAVHHVRMPPWAKNPHELVAAQRAALESEYVSAHLHEWIDLIFGYKQIGPEAIAADNLFYYLTYADAVDLQAINDPILRAATEAQIAHFGQTPNQLFRRPHISRMSLEASAHALIAYPLPMRINVTMDRLIVRSRGNPSGNTTVSTGTSTNPFKSRSGSITGTLTLSTKATVSTSSGTVHHGTLSERMNEDYSLPLLTAVGALDVFTAAPHPTNANQATAIAGARASASGTYLSDTNDFTRRRLTDPAFAGTKPMLVSSKALSGTSQSLVRFFPVPTAKRLMCVYGDTSIAMPRWSPSFSNDGLPYELRNDKLREPAVNYLFLWGKAWTVPNLDLPCFRSGHKSAIPHWNNNALVDLSRTVVSRTTVSTRKYNNNPLSLSQLLFQLSSRSTNPQYGPVLATHSWSAVILDDDVSVGAISSTSANGNNSIGTGTNNNIGTLSGGGGSGAGVAGISSGIVSSNAGISSTSGVAGSTSIGNSDGCLLFTSGYADGGLRWQRHTSNRNSSASTVDAWIPRESGRAADISVVAADESGGRVRGQLPWPSIVTGHVDGRVNVWRIVKGASSDVHWAAEESYSTFPGGLHTHHLFASSSLNDRAVLSIVGTITGTILVRVGEISPALASPVTTVVLSGDLRIVVMGGVDGTVMIADSLTGQVLRSLPLPAPLVQIIKVHENEPEYEHTYFPLPVQHIVVLSSGHIVVHWSLGFYGNGTRDDNNTHGSVYTPLSVLATYTLNGVMTACTYIYPLETGNVYKTENIEPWIRTMNDNGTGSSNSVGGGGSTGYGTAVLPIATTPFPWITSLIPTTDGFGFVVGTSDGNVSVYHGISLEIGGYFRLHEEPLPMVEIKDDQIPMQSLQSFTGSNVISSPFAGGGLGSGLRNLATKVTSTMDDIRNINNNSSSNATMNSTAMVPTPREGNKAPRPSSSPLPSPFLDSIVSILPSSSSSTLPSVAVTTLLLTDGGKYLLAGCGDGRLMVITDTKMISKQLESTLQQSVFSLV